MKRGIGAKISAQLAGHGATVHGGARDTDDVTDDAARLVRLDVTNDDQIEAAVDRIVAAAGRLDVVVNNASLFPESGPLHETTTADLDRTLAVYLQGPTLVTEHRLPTLTERESVRVVNFSLDLGRYTNGEMSGNYPPYRLSKVELGGLTPYLYDEHREEGLIANAVSPAGCRPTCAGRRRLAASPRARRCR